MKKITTKLTVGIFLGGFCSIVFGLFVSGSEDTAVPGATYVQAIQQSQIGARESGRFSGVGSLGETSLDLHFNGIEVDHQSLKKNGETRLHSFRVSPNEDPKQSLIALKQVTNVSGPCSPLTGFRMTNVLNPRNYYNYWDFNCDGLVDEVVRILSGDEVSRWIIADIDWLEVIVNVDDTHRIVKQGDASLQASLSDSGWILSPVESNN